MCDAISSQFPVPSRFTHSSSNRSSSGLHVPFLIPGRSTFVYRCMHCVLSRPGTPTSSHSSLALTLADLDPLPLANLLHRVQQQPIFLLRPFLALSRQLHIRSIAYPLSFNHYITLTTGTPSTSPFSSTPFFPRYRGPCLPPAFSPLSKLSAAPSTPPPPPICTLFPRPGSEIALPSTGDPISDEFVPEDPTDALITGDPMMRLHSVTGTAPIALNRPGLPGTGSMRKLPEN